MLSSQNPGNPRFTFAPPGTHYEVLLFPDKFVPGALCGMVNDGLKEGKIVAIENHNPLNEQGDVVVVELVGETVNLIHGRIVENPAADRREGAAALKTVEDKARAEAGLEAARKALEATKKAELEATLKRQAEYKSRLAKEVKEKSAAKWQAELDATQKRQAEYRAKLEAKKAEGAQRRLEAADAERKAQREEALAREARDEKALEAFMASLTPEGKKAAYVTRAFDFPSKGAEWRNGEEHRLLEAIRNLCQTRIGEDEARRIWEHFSEGVSFPQECVPPRVADAPKPEAAPKPEVAPAAHTSLLERLFQSLNGRKMGA